MFVPFLRSVCSSYSLSTQNTITYVTHISLCDWQMVQQYLFSLKFFSFFPSSNALFHTFISECDSQPLKWSYEVSTQSNQQVAFYQCTTHITEVLHYPTKHLKEQKHIGCAVLYTWHQISGGTEHSPVHMTAVE